MTEPYYADDLVTLYLGDALNLDVWHSADLLVCDPPYGRSWRQGAVKGARRSDARAPIRNDDDTAVRDAILAAWGDRPAVVFGDLLIPPPAGTKQVAVYRKPPDAGVRGTTAGVRRDVEGIYLVGPFPSSGMGGRSSVFGTAARTVGGTVGLVARAGGHPHTKPVDVLAELMALAPGTIADPTAGGGSTLVAAQLLGRPAIGVELDERWAEVAAKRLSQGVLG